MAGVVSQFEISAGVETKKISYKSIFLLRHADNQLIG